MMLEMLERGEWRAWREANLGNPEALAIAARGWCESAYWNHHTPALEDWKNVASDLAGRGLPRDAVFPTIPLFEQEQARDLGRAAKDADELALIADAAERAGDQLTLAASEAARCCWGDPKERRFGLAFSAWQWMRAGQIALPAPEEAATLLAASSPRRVQAIERIRAAVLAKFDANEGVEEAVAVADALGFWTDRDFIARSAARAGPVRDQRHARLDELRAGQWKRLALALFDSGADPAQWTAADPAALSLMAREVAAADPPAESETRAWESLKGVLARFPALLGASRGRVPAFDLAAAVRSKTTAGVVAIDLLRLAGTHRSDPAWWRALLASVAPTPRRGPLGNAGDRTASARLAVKLQRKWLRPEEAAAMDAAFSEDR